MKYLLDTDAFSDIVRGNINVEWRFSQTPISLIGISSVTVKEIEYGRRLKESDAPCGAGKRLSRSRTWPEQSQSQLHDGRMRQLAVHLRQLEKSFLSTGNWA